MDKYIYTYNEKDDNYNVLKQASNKFNLDEHYYTLHASFKSAEDARKYCEDTK